ncbi:MAG: hypothetical protein FJZ63_02700 [Chlamydiae bacterium]|nr:hypothetical protein [Chlamydiota bacterium]
MSSTIATLQIVQHTSPDANRYGVHELSVDFFTGISEDSNSPPNCFVNAIEKDEQLAVYFPGKCVWLEPKNISYALCRKNIIGSIGKEKSNTVALRFIFKEVHSVTMEFPITDTTSGPSSLKAIIEKCKRIGKNVLMISNGEETIIVNRRHLVQICAERQTDI